MTKEQYTQLYEFLIVMDDHCPHSIIPGAEGIKCHGENDDACIKCWKKAVENTLEIE